MDCVPQKKSRGQTVIDYSKKIDLNFVGSFPQDTDYVYEPTKPIVYYDASGNPRPLEVLPTFAPFVDLKPDVHEVDDQLAVPSCTANAGTSAPEWILKYDHRPLSLSRLFNYWVSRNIINELPGQIGSSVRSAIRAIKHFGVPAETTWPYIPAQVDTRPTEEAFSEASTRVIQRYEIIKPVQLVWWTREQKRDNLVLQIKSALNEGIPVVFSCNLNDLWYSVSGPWQEHQYTYPADGHPTVGGHAMVIIGYDDASGRFLIENSWGSQWGDGGFGGMPYDALYNSMREFFIVRCFDGTYLNDPLQAQWDWIQKMYLGFYGRPADLGGMLYWRERLINEGFGAIVEAFMTSPEAAGLYTPERMAEANRQTRKG